MWSCCLWSINQYSHAGWHKEGGRVGMITLPLCILSWKNFLKDIRSKRTHPDIRDVSIKLLFSQFFHIHTQKNRLIALIFMSFHPMGPVYPFQSLLTSIIFSTLHRPCALASSKDGLPESESQHWWLRDLAQVPWPLCILSFIIPVVQIMILRFQASWQLVLNHLAI